MESGDLSQDGDETVPAKETFRGRLLIFVKRTGEGEIGLSVKAVGKEKKIIFGA
jgi:hypothetical protein